MVTHPAGPLRSGTLVNALLHHLTNLSGVGGVLRPGIVHRLDRGTTGLLIVAKNDEAHRRLAEQLRERTLKRTYLAVAWGVVTPDEFTIEAPIGRDPRDRKRMAVVPGGREATSFVHVLGRTELVSAVRVELETGRTHQIRVHLRSRGHAVVGDSAYGGRKGSARAVTPHLANQAAEILATIERPALHARALRFVHPDRANRWRSRVRCRRTSEGSSTYVVWKSTRQTKSSSIGKRN
jgi:23S rRNA pseudouridine1911/1915/1917 synthase